LAITAAGDEFLANLYTAGVQQVAPQTQSVAAAEGGGFVVAFTGKGTGDDSGVFAQRFASDESRVGSAILVNTTTSGDQLQASIAGTGDGRFVVVWSGQGSHDRHGIHARVFNAAGVAVTTEIAINATTLGDQDSPAVAIAADGSFFVAWSGNGAGDQEGIFLRRFDAAGAAIGGEVLVNQATHGVQAYPSLAIAGDGTLIVTWSSRAGHDGDDWGVYARRFSATGTPLSDQFQVNSGTALDQAFSRVGAASDGSFAIVWSSRAQDGDDWGVYAQRFSSSGSPVGSEFQVNSTTNRAQRTPNIATAPSGRFVVTWISAMQDGSGWGVLAQSFNADGTRDGGEVLVNSTTSAHQRDSSAAFANDEGEVIFVWTGTGVDDRHGVFARRFMTEPTNLAPTIQPIADRTIDELTLLELTVMATDPDGPQDELVFSLATGAPEGATIDSATGLFQWTPAEAQGPGTFTITVNVADQGTPVRTASTSFQVTVREVNQSPNLAPIANQTANVGQELRLDLSGTVTDPDLPANTITFMLDPDMAPEGAAITPGGVFTFTPTTAGAVTIRVLVIDGADAARADSETFTVTVNGPPTVANPIADVTANEDAAAIPNHVDLDDVFADVETDSQLAYNIQANTPDGIVVAAIEQADNTLDLSFVVNAVGTVTITVRATDAGGLSVEDTFTVTVNAVNDAPSFTAGPNQAVNEDAPAQSVAWATAISAGPANESGQTLTFEVTNNNNAMFSVQPAISADGTLTYTLAPSANGMATVTVQLMDDGGTANGGIDASAEQTFTITVTPVNDAPTLDAIEGATILEDASEQMVNLSGIGSGAADETQTLMVTAVSDNPALVPNPSVEYTSPNTTGILRYTPVANANGMATITVTVNDGGGGSETFSRQFTVTVTAVNDAPSFTAGPNQEVDEDAGAQSVAWATAISAGPANESGQTLTFVVTTDNNVLFSAPPAIAADGTLAYTPAANAHGMATVTVQLMDDAGTANGGIDTSAEQTFTITVAAVNDAPSVAVPIDDLEVNEDAATMPNYVDLDDVFADVDNNDSELVYTLQANTPNGIVTATIDPADNTLDLSFVADAFGTVTITVRATDPGNASFDESFTVTVNSVNDAPSFTAGDDQTVNEDAGVQTVADWATGISFGPANESPQTVNFLVTNNTNALFSAQPAIAPDGTLTYTPADNANGTATVSVQLMDSGGVANGGMDTSATQTFTITVTPVNDAPTVAAPIADLGVVEGAEPRLDYVDLDDVFDDVDSTLTYVIVSNLPPGVVDAVIQEDGTLDLTFIGEFGSMATITIEASDGEFTIQNSFEVRIRRMPEVVMQIPDLTVAEDAAPVLDYVNLNDIFADGDTPDDQLTYTVGMITPTGVVNVAIGADDTLDLSFVANAFTNPGSPVTVTVRATDQDGLFAEETFAVTVTPVNDLPTLNDPANLTIAEDSGEQTVNLAGIGTGAANETQTLSITALSDNTSLIPDPTVTYTSPNATGTLRFTPVANATGTATITVTVSDGTDSLMQTFTVEVTPVNDPPTLDAIPNPAAILEDAGEQTVNLAGIGTGAPNEIQTLIVTASSSNTNLIPNPTVDYTSPSATGSLRYTPVANANGAATITVTVSDGVNSVMRTFTVMVTAVNDPPTLNDPADLVIAEDAPQQTVSLTGIGTGATNETQTLSVTAVSNNTSLIPNPTIIYTSPNSTGTLRFTPVANANGVATITVTVSDGVANVMQSFNVMVTPVNDAPTVPSPIADVSVADGSTPTQIDLRAAFQDVEDPDTALMFDVVSNTNPSLFVSTPIAAGVLTLNYAVGVTGSATITVRATDTGPGPLSVTDEFHVSVGQPLTFLESIANGDGGIDGLDGATAVAISPNTDLSDPSDDGRHLYAVGAIDGAIAVFERDIDTGALTFVQVVKDEQGGVTSLAGASALAISGDGMHVYVTSEVDDALTVFRRNATTGQLEFVEVHREGVDFFDGLDGASAVAISRDGLRVYVTARLDDSLVVFDRDDSTGELTLVGVIRDGQPTIDGLNGASGVAVSDDGQFVYVTAFDEGAVSVFEVDFDTGALAQRQVVRDGVGQVTGLGGAEGLVLSGDFGSNLYVTGRTDGELTVFDRDPVDGMLSFLQKHTGIGGPTELAISPDDRDVFVTARNAGELVFFRRELNGTLIDRASATGLVGAAGVVVSPDSIGLHVYVASSTLDAVSVFDRDDNNGDLTSNSEVVDGQGAVTGLSSAFDVVVSPNGNHVYATGGASNSVAVFRREPTGLLTFLESFTDGQGGVNGLAQAQGITISPNGSHVYVASRGDDAIAIFSRDGDTGLLTFVTSVAGPQGAFALALDAAGVNLYVVGRDSDRLRIFTRNTTNGTLTQLGSDLVDNIGVDGLDEPVDVVVSPDGTRVYTAAFGESKIGSFIRNTATGSLTFREAIADGVGVVDGLAMASSVTVSSDSLDVYVSGFADNGIAVFRRNLVTGLLEFQQVVRNGVAGVVNLVGPADVLLSPDGTLAYATGATADSLVVFNRNTTTGLLTFIQSLVDGAAGVDGLNQAQKIAQTVNGRHVYVTGMSDNSIAAFREGPPNNAPTINVPIADVTVDEDAPNTVVPLLNAFQDVEDAASALVYSIHENTNSGLFDAVTLDQAANTLTLDYKVNASGTAEITVRATDTEGGFVDQTILVTIREVTSFSITNRTLSEGNSGPKDFEFTVTLNDPINFAITVDVTLMDGTATIDDDYEPLEVGTSPLVFSPGQPLSQVVTVVVNGDTFAELDETFFVKLTDATLDPIVAPIADVQGTGTITNDDPVLTFLGFENDGDPADLGIQGARSIAISSNNQHVYVAGHDDSALALFRRDDSTGDLTFVELYRPEKAGVNVLVGVNRVTISPDGVHVYALAPSLGAGRLAIFRRNDIDGKLTFANALDQNDAQGVASATGIAVSPDDDHVYVTSSPGIGVDHLAVFARSAATDVLTFVAIYTDGVGGIDGFGGARGVAVSPDNLHVYAAGAVDDAIAMFSRTPATGELSFLGRIRDTDPGVDGLDQALEITFSPNGANLYVTSPGEDSIAVFNRNATSGLLTFGQVLKDGQNGVSGLTDATGVVVSMDGLHVFVTSSVPGTGGADAVAVFSRNTTTGALTFVEHHVNLPPISGMNGPIGIVVSPDGQNVYIAAEVSNTVVRFARNAPGGSGDLATSMVANDATDADAFDAAIEDLTSLPEELLLAGLE